MGKRRLMEFDTWNKRMFSENKETVDLTYSEIFKTVNALNSHFSFEFETDKGMLFPPEEWSDEDRINNFEVISVMLLAKAKHWDDLLDKLLPYYPDGAYNMHWTYRVKEIIEEYRKYLPSE